MKIMICSGAGLSAESGVPTFRDSGGLWHQYPIEKVCDLRNFYENYDLVHDFYDKRRVELASVNPNAAHLKIAEISKRFEVVNITTNVDDLLERAGCDNVIHLHGNLREVIEFYDTENEQIIDIGYEKSDFENPKKYPMKPNVVFFSEYAPKYQDFANATSDLEEDDIVIIVGSSENVVMFVENIIDLGRFTGKVIFVNPDRELCDRTFVPMSNIFNMGAVEFFSKIEEIIPELKG